MNHSNRHFLFLIIVLLPIVFHISVWKDEHSVSVTFYYIVAVLVAVLSFIFARYFFKNYYTLQFFLIYILVSYFYRIQQVENNIDDWTITGGYQRVGDFNFNDEMYISYFEVIIYGTIGLVAGSIFALFFYRTISDKNKSNVYSNAELESNKKHLSRIKQYYIGYLGVIIGSSFLKIGVSGVSPIALPFHLTGMILFLKNFVIPMIGWHLFFSIVKSADKKIINKFLLMQVLIGIISTYLTMSKAMLIYAIVPFILYLIISNGYIVYPLKQRIYFFLSCLILFPLTFYGAIYLRAVYFGGIDNLKLIEYFSESYFRGSDTNLFVLIFEGLLNDISSRITGGSELMAVIPSHIHDPYNKIFMILSGKAGDINSGMVDLIKNIFDITLVNDGEMISGKSIGFWGVFFIAKSLGLVLLLSFVFSFVIQLIEIAYLNYINKSISVCLAFWLTYNVWESGFDLFVFMIPIVVVYLLFNRVKFTFRNVIKE